MLKSVDLEGQGLEIGPLCWPVLTKSEAKIKYVDHTTTEGLQKLYKGDKGIKQSEIVAVDYPLNNRTLKQTVGRKRFDFILASHVIEHVPDMISWLNDMASVLNEGGVLSLAIPDKRFTFDIDRDVSRPADIIGAHLDGVNKPNSVTVFDYFFNYRSKVDPRQAWDGQLYLTEDAGPHRYRPKDAKKYCEVSRDTDQYIDTHCFVFTPTSLVEAMRVILELSLVPFETTSFYPTSAGEYEFFITFRKNTKKSSKQLIETLPPVIKDPTIRELEVRIAQLEHSLEESEAAFAEITSSKSWSVTKPLRHASKLASNLRKPKQ